MAITGMGAGDERHEVEAYLASDATKLRAWVRLPEPSQALKLAKSE